MKQLAIAIVLLLLPAFAADAASSLHRKHPAQKARTPDPAADPSSPPVTRLPIAPDTFRA